MSIENLRESLKRFTGLFIGSSVFMILVGVLAIAMPLAAGIGISIFVSWLIFLTGLAHLVYAFAARGVGGFAWRLVLGIVYVAGGVYLGFRPGLSLVSLTLALAIILFVEGLMQSLAYFSLRELPGSRWILFDGIVTLVLGLLILLSWPSGSAWAIGTLVGINFLFSGLTRLGYSGTARKALV
ncbi:MAG TPA: DUF308 domain-containing protein [Terracidiphilus sp.]|jgi:uncharacterized membrane protein HdeD (DUF308 family)